MTTRSSETSANYRSRPIMSGRNNEIVSGEKSSSNNNTRRSWLMRPGSHWTWRWSVSVCMWSILITKRNALWLTTFRPRPVPRHTLSLSLSLELSGLGKQERNCALSIFYNPKAKCEVWSVKYTQRAQHFSAFESFSASLTHVSSDRNILLEVGLGNALMPHSLNTTR